MTKRNSHYSPKQRTKERKAMLIRKRQLQDQFLDKDFNDANMEVLFQLSTRR